LQGWSLAVRLAVAIILSPVVATVEFFALRVLGFSFSQNAWALVLLNAFALLVIWRFADWRLPSAKSVKWCLFTFLILALTAGFPWLVYSNARMFTGHTLMHTGLIYQIEAGQTYLEEPEMAGLRLSYPWPGDVDWAVLSWILNWGPTRTYVLTNMVWLAAFCVVFLLILRECGISPFGSALAAVWMGLGTNIVSHVYVWAALNFLHHKATMRGDMRFTPWVRKFTMLGMNGYGCVLLALIILAGIRAWQTRKPVWLALALVSYGGLGLLYPAMFPVAAIFAGVLCLASCFSFAGGKLHVAWRTAAVLAVALGVLTGLLSLYIGALTRDRTIPSLTLSTVQAVLWKIKSAPFVLAPFLAAAVFVPLRLWKGSLLRLLLATAGLTGMVTVFLNVGRDGTEYKLVLGMAMLLAPLIGLAADLHLKTPLLRGLGVLLTLLLLIPALSAMRKQWGLNSETTLPYLRDNEFQVRLDGQEAHRQWVNVVREGTPRDTVLVVRATTRYLPALADRSLWAPPAPEIIPGYWMESDENLIAIRGYSEAVYNHRVDTMAQLFSDDAQKASAVLAELQRLGRPVAIVVAGNEGKVLRELLGSRKDGRLIYRAPQSMIWLLFSSR